MGGFLWVSNTCMKLQDKYFSRPSILAPKTNPEEAGPFCFVFSFGSTQAKWKISPLFFICQVGKGNILAGLKRGDQGVSLSPLCYKLWDQAQRFVKSEFQTQLESRVPHDLRHALSSSLFPGGLPLCLGHLVRQPQRQGPKTGTS